MRRKFCAVLLAGLAMSAGMSFGALAATSGVVLVSETVPVTVEDGTATGELTVLNATDAPIPVRVAVVDGAKSCTEDVEPEAAPAGRQKDLTVTLAGCRLDNRDAPQLRVAAEGQQPWTIALKVADDSAALDWDRLAWSFGGALAVSFVVVFVVFARWDGGESAAAPAKDVSRREKRKTKRRGWGSELPGLGGTYDLSKSWASNVTIVAGVFAGVLGSSDVLKALLGTEDKELGALVLVAAALAAALVAAGPLVVLATKKNKRVTVFGLLLAAWLTLTGSGGQLVVLVLTGGGLDLGFLDNAIWVLGVLGVVLLGVYAYRSLTEALDDGIKEPTEDDAAEIAKAAADGLHEALVGSGQLEAINDAGDRTLVVSTPPLVVVAPADPAGGVLRRADRHAAVL